MISNPINDKIKKCSLFVASAFLPCKRASIHLFYGAMHFDKWGKIQYIPNRSKYKFLFFRVPITPPNYKIFQIFFYLSPSSTNYFIYPSKPLDFISSIASLSSSVSFVLFVLFMSAVQKSNISKILSETLISLSLICSSFQSFE